MMPKASSSACKPASSSYTNKNELYYEVTRHLVERLSWMCKGMRKVVPEGNGKAKIIFSRRGGIDYEDLQRYFRALQEKEERDNTAEIYWPVIDIEGIEAQDHSKLAGLQIADCISSAFRMAVDPDEFGNCEPRYAEQLKVNTYSNHKGSLHIGLKPIPDLLAMTLNVEQRRFFEGFAIS
ncbi:MAG: DUF3800 domain-containing protein [Rickettsiales bacterium]|nr:DUF3800 domain-containing protein [Rickettsiales bacterium]